jgi:S-DNA-T family DNA segregation ATPase FtsK/SpoIIIE
MHAMMCSFVARNTPADVRLLMIDMKFNGIELDRYRGVPHMITDVKDLPDGIAGTPEEALKVLKWIVEEGNRRGRMFKEEGAQNLKAWNNKHRTRKLPSIVCVSDELALLRLDPTSGNEAYNLIREISSVARAAGIHLVTFTQSSNKRVIDEMIKVNFPGRICFSVPDASSSILFVGDGSAINLMPAGRARFKHGTDNFLAQTPLISAGEIEEIVNNAKAGKTTAKLSKTIVTPEEVITWSIENNNSSLAVADVWNKFSTRIEKHAIERLLKDMEGQTYNIGDRYYQVMPGGSRRPRIVAKIDGNVVSQAQYLRDETRDETEKSDEQIEKGEQI